MSSSSETSASSQVYITKQSNDGVATSYNGMSASNLFNICKSETKNAVIRYLSNVVNEAGRKVLFRGLLIRMCLDLRLGLQLGVEFEL